MSNEIPPRSGSIDEEHKLTPAELRERIKDPNYLPSIKEYHYAFWSEDDDRRDNFRERFYYVNDELHPVYELITRELISSLCRYLASRIELYAHEFGHPITILEVGAGDGRLAHFIREELGPRMQGVASVVATDSGDWNIQPVFPVEMIGHEAALNKYQPQIVIESWMPNATDLSRAFRETPSVMEYLLIGDPSCTGHPWYTWGEAEFLTNAEMREHQGEARERLISNRYSQERPFNFEKIDLGSDDDRRQNRPSTITGQWDRNSFLTGGFGQSTTVSFRRRIP